VRAHPVAATISLNQSITRMVPHIQKKTRRGSALRPKARWPFRLGDTAGINDLEAGHDEFVKSLDLRKDFL
jgi:hypothetical protein